MRRSTLIFSLLWIALPAVYGCDGGQEVVCVGQIVEEDGKLKCKGSGGTVQEVICVGTLVQEGDQLKCYGTAPTQDVAVTTPDSGPTPDVVVDTGPDPELQCSSQLRGSKPMGFACSKHCECDTGYCYDEAYLGDFRFCTRECAGSCESGGPVQEMVCLNLSGSLQQKYGLTKTSICQRRCSSLSDCSPLGSAYDTCGTPGCSGGSISCWEGLTVALTKTCQIVSTVQ